MPLQLDRMADLDAALAGGALLLVPNYRSSDQLVDQLCRHQRLARPGSLLPRPAIRAIDLWLDDLWDQLASLHPAECLGWRVLQPAEEQLLWQRLIRKTSPELLLLNEDGTALAAANAWRLLQQWQIPLSQLRQQLALAGSEETRDDRAYAWAWLQAFDQHCQRNHLLSISGRLQQLLRFVEEGTLAALGLLPATLLLSGFDAPPPLYQALFAAITAQGVAVLPWQFAEYRPAMAQQTCNATADECRAAAYWTAAILAQDPAATIGIVTADSNILKGELQRCFAQMFADKPAAFSSTLPATLAEAPYVHTAVAALYLLEDQIDTLACCALLRSPWLMAAEEEADARAELELRLRKSRAQALSSSELRSLCLQQDKTWHCPQLGTALLALQQDFLRQSPRQTLQVWLQFFATFWDALLPRSTLLQSGNRSLVKGWESLLKQADSCSVLFGTSSFAEARNLLLRFCRASTLPTGNSQAPVLLLTPVTAAGLHFTHLWCMQMTDALWPGDQQPHPYLPLSLQKQYAMPGADRHQSLQQGLEYLQGLIRCTTVELVFSHAAREDDLPQRATPLLPADLLQRAHVQGLLPGNLHPALAMPAQPALQRLDDITCIPLPEGQSFQGGSGILTSQSACPFKSFAQYRLQALELPAPQYGIPPQALGDCVHEALRRFWLDMQNHAALLAAGHHSLEQAVQRALAPALQTLAQLYPAVLTPKLLQLETRRLSALLLRWLDIEKQRGPFTVAATEATLLWVLPGLQLKLRLDRIDQLEDGSCVIVDYKTGKSASQRWEEERPPAPQLLLYQQATDADGRFGPTAALLYGGINVENPDYSGIAANGSIYPGLEFAADKTLAAPDWQHLKQRWQQIISQLAAEFVQGYVAVQPARKDSCTHCHLSSLCRINEVRLAVEDES